MLPKVDTILKLSPDHGGFRCDDVVSQAMSFNYGQRPRNGGRSSEHPRGGNGSIGRPEAGFDEVVRTGGGKGPGRTRGGFRREEGYQRGGGDPRRSSPLHGQHPLPEEGRGGPRTMDPPLVETGGEKSIPTGNECVVCCREISVYAVGPCDHTVCYICSTR
ncbi:hypothetical protein BIW11_02635 [Tropilaelaps mercedesae]|uniref:Uncharacterized protein n=1 Tax=Tropilaelaps mercedesae TaxID=418985 RepID=A0A1V9Y009_9ACAR|nr:hypothetical protein BIW11_02635 [Tropilaelaps mercedesae]